MNEILIAVAFVAGIGIIIGIGLSAASEFFSVPKDEKAEAVRECLPGANCGACGYSGCDGYAEAIAKGSEAKINLCSPGGQETADAIAEALGVESQQTEPKAAFVLCGGECSKAKTKMKYQGVTSCKAAMQLFGGEKECAYGCLGYGDCQKVCTHDAIFFCNGIAKVNSALCGACGQCAAACPKGIIRILPAKRLQAVVVCNSNSTPKETFKQCEVGCIGCGKCQKTCPHGAITVENNLARVDTQKCTGCGECAAVCPKKCIEMVTLEQ